MNAAEVPEPRPVDDQDLENARQALASLRSLVDPMSGRIDNWSDR